MVQDDYAAVFNLFLCFHAKAYHSTTDNV